VWTCTWMSFTSHTFTSLPLVHTPNPDFLRRRLWLGLLLIRESPDSGSLHTPRFPNSNFGRLPNFADFRFHDFAGSWLRELRRSKTSDLCKFATSDLRRFEIPDLRKFKIPELRELKIPDLRRFKILNFAGSRFLKTHFTNFIKLDVLRVTDFPEFPQHWSLLQSSDVVFHARFPRRLGRP
jgi:hypothetical protein